MIDLAPLRIRKSDAIGQLVEALAACQGQWTNPPRDRTVTVQPKDGGRPYSFKYAELGTVLDTIRKPLSEAGLALIQIPTINDRGPVLVTTLAHKTGEFIEFEFSLGNGGGSMQQQGSAITYARRYCALSILGLVADDDDDGNAASGNQVTNSQQHQRPQPNGNGNGNGQSQKPQQQANGGQQGGSQKPPVRVTIDPHGDEMKALIAALDQAGLTEADAKYDFASTVLGRDFRANPRITQDEANTIKAAAAKRTAELNEVPG